MRRVLIAVIFFAGARASAQTFNYQALLGQRAAGMGGAYTAISDDPTATFYNPGGLGQLRQQELEVGLPVLGIYNYWLNDGLVAKGTGQATDFYAVSLPSSVGAAGGIGPNDAEGNPFIIGAVSFYLPWQHTLQMQQAVAGQGALHIVDNSEQAVLAGPSIGVRIGHFGVGLSMFLVQENFSWLETRAGTEPVPYQLTGFMKGWESELNFRLGGIWQANSHWRLGAMFSLSSVRVFGNAAIKSENQIGGASPQATVLDRENLRTNFRLPWEIRLGAAYSPHKDWLLSADLDVNIPDNLALVAVAGQSAIFFPGNLTRRTVVNGALGLEHRLPGRMNLRFGAFTDFSALNLSSDCGTQACFGDMNNFGVTSALGFQIWRVALDVGVSTAFGYGHFQNIADPVGPTFHWSNMESLGVQVFVGGNIGHLVERGAEKIQDRIVPILDSPMAPKEQ